MAHFAKLGLDNEVIGVHIIDNENLLDANGNEQEQIGIDYLTKIHGSALWVQTSYNNNIRKNYAGVGYKYDEARDAFIPPKLYPSWTLDEDTCLWDSPTPYPDDGGEYLWDEDAMSWENLG